MATFRIGYRDPETGEDRTVDKEFEDSHLPFFIAAKFWAEDYAYMLADKGQYTVRELQ